MSYSKANVLTIKVKKYTTVILPHIINKAVKRVEKSFKLTFSSADTSAILGSGGGARFFINSKTSRERMTPKSIRKLHENSSCEILHKFHFPRD